MRVLCKRYLLEELTCLRAPNRSCDALVLLFLSFCLLVFSSPHFDQGCGAGDVEAGASSANLPWHLYRHKRYRVLCWGC
jgi:hypothetical protein